jgi:superfamily II DNA or RNA helicase
MSNITRTSTGNSGSEDKFIELFCETFGAEKGQYVYLQYPIVDIYGNHRSIDFAVQMPDGRVAIEVDGNTWHQPGIIGEQKYHDDLLKQNSMVFEGWKVYRWTSAQLDKNPQLVQDELVTFLGDNPLFQYIEDALPPQQGSTFSLMDHQEEALANLAKMREENQTIALLYHATGTGKTTTAVSDVKAVGKRTLFLAHRHELLEQAANTFRKLWPEVTVGMYEGGSKDTNAYVICGSIQSVAQNLEAFSQDDFGYLVIDECHHGTAETYRRIMSYFHPSFTLGLTATPERMDGEDLLGIFQNVAHKLDLRSAVELGTLVPVRCIRIKTNIDMRDVRISGFRYNTQDLESTIKVPERNQLIVDTWTEYVKDKPTVVFCASVDHAEEITERFENSSVNAKCISGHTKASERRQTLEDYEQGKIQVLCACDLLNEGWDSPHTQVLFMARPTMSKTIYLQQLGRGMRKSPGKDFLMVFDFVDNANMFNMPYSIHRMLSIGEYTPGGMVLGTKHAIQYDHDMFTQGEKPEVLVDYPIHMTGYEMVDLFNWQEKAKDMVSQIGFTQMVTASSETIEKYIREEKIKPDMEVPIGEKRSFKFFEKDTVKKYAKEFGWTVITKDNQKEIFMDMVKTMQMSYSYKPVFLLSFLKNMNETGSAKLEDVAKDFAAYYENRKERGLPPEKKQCIFTKGDYTEKDVEQLILRMPFKRFEDMHAMHHAKQLGIIEFYKSLAKQLTEEDYDIIRQSSEEALKKYFGEDKGTEP